MSHLAYDTSETDTAVSSASNGFALFPRFFEKGKLRRIRRVSASGSMLIETYGL